MAEVLHLPLGTLVLLFVKIKSNQIKACYQSIHLNVLRKMEADLAENSLGLGYIKRQQCL